MKLRILQGFSLFSCCFLAVFLAVNTVAAQANREDKEEVLSITEIQLNPSNFNAAAGETTRISFAVSRSAKVLLQIFDTDQELITEFVTACDGASSRCEIAWDGRDNQGQIVPDEAYSFTLEAFSADGAMTSYDPYTFSGGENISVAVGYDGERQRIFYHLDNDARIVIRAGVKYGPMLKNVVNWAPRTAGEKEEHWDGKDESGVLSAVNQKDFSLMAEGVTLPENSIITHGNTETSYFLYKKALVEQRPGKKKRPRQKEKKTEHIALQTVQPRYQGVDIRFRLEMGAEVQKTAEGIPVVQGMVPVKIYIDDAVKRYVTEQRYEIISYVDFAFVTEQEEGYSRCTWMWDTRGVSNGEHILNVNVATLTGNMGAADIRVIVQN